MSFSGKLPWNSITDFHEERYRFLNNFYEAMIEYGSLVYGGNGAAFQAQKCITTETFTKHYLDKAARYMAMMIIRTWTRTGSESIAEGMQDDTGTL